MRSVLAMVLIALLPACAATEPALPPGPVLVATSGPHTLRFQDRQSFALHPLGFDPIRDWRLHFRFESTDPDCLVTDMSDFECRAEQGGTVHTERGVAEFWEPGVWELQLPYESVPGNARDLDVDLSIFRVHLWKTWEREGLMDASLDEIEMPPFLIRFAGEGESCWLSVSMMESKQPPTRGPDPSTVVGFEWAAGSVTVVDAKGRDLVRTPGDVRKDLALVQFSTHASGTPPPPGEPTIQYPVKVRLRVPAEWETVVRTFRFRGLQLPESEEPRETVPVGR